MQAAKGVVDEKLSSIKATYEAHGGGVQGTAAVVMEGVKGIFSAGFSFLDTITGGELSNISSLFSNILGTVQSTVGNILEGVKNAFQEKLETAKSIVSDAVDRIKGFFNFKWELPKLKLPHFSITGSFNITPPSVPKFNVEWYKEGGIMTRPTVFGINGSNAMIGGEAGAEAILPLSELWDNLRDFISMAINGSQDTSFAKLSDDVDKVSTINIDQEKENSGFNITYSPVYRFEGATPDKADIVQAERISQTEFDKMMRQWQKDKNRIKF